MINLDVLIFGGGAAGLWCLDRFRRAGYQAMLLESQARGCGQTIQSQGIIHGGGKYALRRVRDFEAVKVIRDMPDRWRRHLRGELLPDLSRARVLSDRCLLWSPQGSFVSRLRSKGFFSMVAKAGLLSTRPEPVPEAEWPEALRGSACAVYAMAEPVIDTATLLEALAAPHRRVLIRYDPGREGQSVEFLADGIVRLSSPPMEFQARAIVLAAGEGNDVLLRRARVEGDVMQRRPLCMFLLKGRLPLLYGHCVIGGRNVLTVTTASGDRGETVWQVGGEVAEEEAGYDDLERARRRAAEALRRGLSALDLSGVEIATYRAVRAEARRKDHRRPSGVHASRVTAGLYVAWPTKLALVPVLVDELFGQITEELKAPAGCPEPVGMSDRPATPVAGFPWQEVQWFPVR